MPLATTVAAAERERAGLSRRLRKLGRVFDLDALRREPLPAQAVVRYYEDCHDAYRKYHSAEGAVHMALNESEEFDPDGFYGQVRRIERDWARVPAAVLELAFGQGFNLAWLAARHPGCRFAGIDITPAHLQIARERMARAGLANVALSPGDFHQLPYADASFDQVFCIEALCYATELPRVLREVSRVLRPGGACTLFDGYLPRTPAQLRPDEALAVELVAKGNAVGGLQVLDEVLAAASAAGLQTAAVTALDAQVMPSLRKLERLTAAVIRWPWLGRLALARRSPMRGRNVLSGYLMRCTVTLGLIGYRHILLRKES
jgi:ubiquinone/menaquinone biosynthesis C-methylase UbiE